MKLPLQTPGILKENKLLKMHAGIYHSFDIKSSVPTEEERRIVLPDYSHLNRKKQINSRIPPTDATIDVNCLECVAECVSRMQGQFGLSNWHHCHSICGC